MRRNGIFLVAYLIYSTVHPFAKYLIMLCSFPLYFRAPRIDFLFIKKLRIIEKQNVCHKKFSLSYLPFQNELISSPTFELLSIFRIFL